MVMLVKSTFSGDSISIVITKGAPFLKLLPMTFPNGPFDLYNTCFA